MEGIKVGIDVMGGDFFPNEIVLGAIQAREELADNIGIVLIGDEPSIKKVLSQEKVDESLFEIVHTTEVIGMSEHPAKAFQKKQDSSIAVGFKLLATNKIQGFASAGNTGAMLVGTMYSVKIIPGIIRPCITSPLPREDGSYGLMLDVGLNPDCKPDVLYQYGILGSLYAEHVYNVKNPKVALLNLGSEEEKGNLLTKATHDLMKGTTDFNFVGNVEGNEMFSSKADVIICDGFTGNIALKLSESFYTTMKRRGIDDEFFNKLDFELYGGTPVLGANSTVIIGHGISKANAIKNIIVHTKNVAEAQLSDKIRKALNHDKN